MNRKFQITEYRIASEFFDGNDRPVRVALLADLHNKIYGKDNDTLLGAIDMMEPDFVLSVPGRAPGGQNEGVDGAWPLPL